MKKKILLASITVLTLLALSAPGVEVLRNGNFDGVLVGWGVPEALGDALPYDAGYGAANLHPDSLDYSYRGTILYQPLNVPLAASDAVAVAVDLRASWSPPAGKSVGVYLEFLDAASARHRVLVLNPTNAAISDGAWQTFTVTHTPAAGLTKLVGITLDKEGDGYFYADNVKVQTPQAGGPVPELGTVSPASVAYGGNVVIQGNHFGAVAGRVTVGGRTNGVTIESWSNQEIVIAVDDPCAGGALLVEAAGVRSWQPRSVAVSSPFYTMSVKPDGMGMQSDTVLAIPGQKARFAVFAGFRNGFEPVGGIELSVLGHGGAGVEFSANPVLRKGGALLTFDTAGLSPGVHELTVQGTGGGLLPRTATFRIDLRPVGNVAMVYYQSSVEIPVDGASFTTQGAIGIVVLVTDTNGTDITWEIPRLPVTSSNPGVLDLYVDSSPWGGNSLLVQGTGSAVLTATTPDGTAWPASVSATVPAHPSFTSAGFYSSPMVNTPGTTNHFTFVASGGMSSVSWGYSSLDASIDGGDWGPGNSSYTGTFVLGGDARPGDYLFHASASVGGQNITTSRRLQVVNAPTTGMVRGHVAQQGGDMHGHGATGLLEFYDAASGDKLFEREIWEYSNDYTAPHIAPGLYKLRWVPQGYGGNLPEPQWFPNAGSFADAQAVSVQANTVANNVNFFLSPSDVPPPPPEIVGAPISNPSAGTFSLTIQTEPNVEYELQKSISLFEQSWWPVAWAYGDGAEQSLQDGGATGAKGFYRIVRK
jgi:hypothetical protein